MTTKQAPLTIEKVVTIIKEKWVVFGASALTILILQLLSSKIILSVLLGLVITYLIPSETFKKVTKKYWQNQRLVLGEQLNWNLNQRKQDREMVSIPNMLLLLLTRLRKRTVAKDDNETRSIVFW